MPSTFFTVFCSSLCSSVNNLSVLYSCWIEVATVEEHLQKLSPYFLVIWCRRPMFLIPPLMFTSVLTVRVVTVYSDCSVFYTLQKTTSGLVCLFLKEWNNMISTAVRGFQVIVLCRCDSELCFLMYMRCFNGVYWLEYWLSRIGRLQHDAGISLYVPLVKTPR